MRELFHRWFYNPEKRGQYERVSYSFGGNFFYSYSTAIGIKITGYNKKPALLIADDSMTPTTARHIRQLAAACPYEAERIIEVPLVYGDHRPTIEEIVTRFSAFFLEYDGARLSKVDNRRQVRNKAAAARQFSEIVRRLPKKVMNALDALDRDAAAIDDKKAGARKTVLARHKAAAEKRAAAAEKKQAATEKKRLAFLKAIPGIPYLDLVKMAFARRSASPERRSVVRSYLVEHHPQASFVWPDGDIIRTSQDMILPAPMVAALVDRWQAGTLPVGSHVGPFTLSEVTPEYIRVGCHKIPIENIKALAAELSTPTE